MTAAPMNATNISRDGAIELIGHEAIVQTRYLDPKIWTIGVGHTASAGPPDPKKYVGKMSLREVFELFMKDVARYVEGVRKALTTPVNQHQFDALVSFHYNTGRIHSASITQAINRGDAARAGECFGQYVMEGGKTSQVLIRRRTMERHLFETGQYGNAGKALLIPADDAGRVLWRKAVRIDVAQALKAEGL